MFDVLDLMGPQWEILKAKCFRQVRKTFALFSTVEKPQTNKTFIETNLILRLLPLSSLKLYCL